MPLDRQTLLSLAVWLQNQQQVMTETLATLVQFETPSGDKTRIDAAQSWLASELTGLEGQLRMIENVTGNHQRLETPGQSQQPATLILGHIDTVWSAGTLARRPWRIDSGIAFGPGAYDMKAGLVVALYALRALQAQNLRPPRPVVLLVTSDEEVGSHSSRTLIEDEARRAAAALVIEPPLAGDALKTARKGVGNFTLTVAGKAAHAGVEPEKGISAILELAHQILAIQGLAAPEQGTTVNVGLIDGGMRTNVVAEQAQARIDVRVSTLAEAQRLVQAMNSLKPVLPGARLQVTGGLNRPPFERGPGTAALFEQATRLADWLGFGPLREGSTGGGSDGNFTAALGIPTLDGLGADGSGAHAEHEQVRLETIPQKAALLAGLLLAI